MSWPMCTELCGTVDPPDPLELTTAFGIAVGETFGFLGPAYGFDHTEVATYHLDNGHRIATPPEAAGFPFLAEVEYVRPDVVVRVTHGDRHYALNVTVERTGEGRHRLQEWLDAVGLDHDLPEEMEWVTTRHSLATHARHLARLLDAHLGAVLAAGPEQRALLGARMRITTADRLRISEAAAAAFAERDYARVAALLEKVEDDLGPSERRKLQFARDKL